MNVGVVDVAGFNGSAIAIQGHIAVQALRVNASTRDLRRDSRAVRDLDLVIYFAVGIVRVFQEVCADFNPIARLAAIGFNIIGMCGCRDNDLIAGRRDESHRAKLVDYVNAGVSADGVLELLAITGGERIRAEYGNACDQTFRVSTFHIASPCIRSSLCDGAGPRSTATATIITANPGSPSRTTSVSGRKRASARRAHPDRRGAQPPTSSRQRYTHSRLPNSCDRNPWQRPRAWIRNGSVVGRRARVYRNSRLCCFQPCLPGNWCASNTPQR